MSYLHTPRLVFSGDFFADVSTVNNDPAHYDNKNFAPNYHKPNEDGLDGWWNPEGGATFDFRNCTVKRYELSNGTVVTGDDELIGSFIKGADGRATGKMVDLDPQMQGCSEIWGVRLRIMNKAGELFLEGELQPTGFRDLQLRQYVSVSKAGKLLNYLDALENIDTHTATSRGLDISNISAAPKDKSGRDAQIAEAPSTSRAVIPPYIQNGQSLGGTWTTILKNVKWGAKADDHPYFKELRATTQNNMICLNLNPFGYYYAHRDGRFTLGRLIGAMGPYFDGEPLILPASRRLLGNFAYLSPRGGYNLYFEFSNFIVDDRDPNKLKLSIDLGASFPLANALGKITLTQKFYIGIAKDTVTWGKSPNDPSLIQAQAINAEDFITIGEVKYQGQEDWLMNTGGVVSFELSPDQAKALDSKQLILLTEDKHGNLYGIGREAANGYFVAADNFVQRIDAHQTNYVYIHAYQWGEPISNASIDIKLAAVPSPAQNKPSEINPNGVITTYQAPFTGYPPTGITFDAEVTTNSQGKALLTITGNPIGTPRDYIDGQIYAVNLELENIELDGLEYNNKINVHLRSNFDIPENPTWEDIKETMTQYSNLYPIMSKYLVDLSDPKSMQRAKDILIFAFSRHIEDPLYMPVTRDLSEAKRITILKWLRALPDTPQHGEGTSFNRKQHLA